MDGTREDVNSDDYHHTGEPCKTHAFYRPNNQDVDRCARCGIRYPDALRGFGSNVSPKLKPKHRR